MRLLNRLIFTTGLFGLSLNAGVIYNTRLPDRIDFK